MSKELFEVRFHGRGGQGAKTAAALLAEAALEQGKFVQSFPDYGAERQGAPVRAFVRISDTPILLHSGIDHPDVVVVVDPTLVRTVPVADGLAPEGILIINTTETKEAISKITGFGGRIVVIDATRISIETLGKPVTNTAMLGAFEKATDLVNIESLKNYLLIHFTKKLGKDVAEKNLNSMMKAYDEVKL